MREEDKGVSQSQSSGDAKSAAGEVQPSAEFTTWSWSPGDTEVTCWTDEDDAGDIVCEAPPQDCEGSFAKWPCHARLIAAAPDGYAAAKALTTKYAATDFPRYMQDDWAALEAFVAKAEGRSLAGTSDAELGPGRTSSSKAEAQ